MRTQFYRLVCGGLAMALAAAFSVAASTFSSATAVEAGKSHRSQISVRSASGDGSVLFIENAGQYDPAVRFHAYGLDPAMWVTDDAIWFMRVDASYDSGQPGNSGPLPDLVPGVGKPLATLVNPPALFAPYNAPRLMADTGRLTGNALGTMPMADTTVRAAVIKVSLTSSMNAASPRPEPLEAAGTRVSFYPTGDPGTWRTGAPAWLGLIWRGLLPGVDLVVTGQAGRLAWHLACDGDCADRAADLVLRVEGADGVSVTDEGGSLDIATGVGQFTLPALVSPGAGSAGMIVRPAGPHAFDVARPFISSEPAAARSLAPRSPDDAPSALLVSTFFGGRDHDVITSMAQGPDGALYITGYTGSTDLYFQPSTPGVHTLDLRRPAGRFTGPIFVAKFRPDLGKNSRVYLTFLGDEYQGSGLPVTEIGQDIAVDAQGSAYVVGQTASYTFPVTSGAYATAINRGRVENCPSGWSGKPCSDAFAVKLTVLGALAYSTYLGGSQLMIPGSPDNHGGYDYGLGIAVDSQGRMLVAGETDSDDFPTTPGAYDRQFSYVDIGLNTDIFVARLNPAGQGGADLQYSTYVGAGFKNLFGGMDVDQSGRVYVTGQVEGRSMLIPPKIDFPRTPGAYPTTSQCIAYDCTDVFFFKLDPGGNGTSDMLYSTFFGGTVYNTFENEGGRDVVVDATGAVILVGQTDAPDYPTTASALMTRQPNALGMSAFVSKLNPAGNGSADMLYSTYLGGDRDSEPNRVAVDALGHVYVTGYTRASNFPYTQGAFCSVLSGYTDAFVSRLQLLGGGASDLVYSTYLGGYEDDAGSGLVVASPGVAVVAGRTRSNDFPATPDAYNPAYASYTCNGYPCMDGFMSKMAVGYSTVTGLVRDAWGRPVAGARMSANGRYYATADRNGAYTFSGLPAGTFTLTGPVGLYWTPERRLVAVPPDAANLNFTGSHAAKRSLVAPATALGYGAAITYQISLISPTAGSLRVIDAIPTDTEYIAGSLVSSAPGVSYDGAARAVGGILALSAYQTETIVFSARVAVTATPGFAPVISNRACVRQGSATIGDCDWSNTVYNYTRPRLAFLPVTMR